MAIKELKKYIKRKRRIPPSFDLCVGKTVKPVIALWAHDVIECRRLTLNTFNAYQRDLQEFFFFMREHRGNVLEANDLRGLCAQDIRSFLAERYAAGVTTRSLARLLASLRSFFGFLEKEHLHGCGPSIAHMVRVPRFKPPLPRSISQRDALFLTRGYKTPYKDPSCLSSWVHLRDYALYSLLYGTGMRISEALSLSWGDLRILCKRMEHERSDVGQLRVRGKGNKMRDLPILPRVKDAILRYIMVCPFKLKLTSQAFRGAKGGPLSSRVVRARLARLRQDLPDNSRAAPHKLRHAFATHLLASGADLRAIQELLGHESLSSTQIYTQINAIQVIRAIQKVHPRHVYTGERDEDSVRAFFQSQSEIIPFWNSETPNDS